MPSPSQPSSPLNLQAIESWLGFPVITDPLYSVSSFPIDGHKGTGAGVTERGSLCVDEPTGQLWINANSLKSPTWLAIGRAKLERMGADEPGNVPEESVESPCEKPTVTNSSLLADLR